jgi:cobalt/nickel transport protein
MKRNRKFILIGLGACLVVAFFLSPWASSLPDGLEKVIEKFAPGGESREADSSPSAPLPDYGVPGVGSDWLSTGIAGLVGTVVVFAVVLLLAKVLARKSPSAPRGKGEE